MSLSAAAVRNIARIPLTRALLLSTALHLVLLGLIQVAPVNYEPSVTVLQVQLPERGSTEVVAEPAQAVAANVPPTPQAVTAPVPPQPVVPSALAPEPVQAATKAEPAPAPLSLPSPVDLRWYGAREVDSHPRALTRIEPAYPEAARRRGQTGWVKLRLKIDEFGAVQDAEVVEASPTGVFDAATLQAFEQARFEPARRQGRPVRYEGYFRVMFELD